MPLWMSYLLACVFAFVTTFLGVWAIREGGSFGFLAPSHWKKGPKSGVPGSAGRDSRA